MQSTTPAEESNTQRRIPSDYYAIRRQLGKGHNAVVYLVEYNSDPTPRAMKKILRNNKKTENMNRLRANNPARAPPADSICGTEETKIRKEIAIMKKCDHPNIIKFYSFIDDQASASICLIMEFMEGGELQWTIDDEPYLTMDQTRRCIRDVVLGLQYLHYQGIIHRDIKPSNIMWTADRSHVKIGDFGIAHLADPDSELNDAEGLRHAGTPAFLAPEIAPGGDAPMGAVTPAVDLWALGVTLFCMLFGRKPFAAHPAAASQIAAEASLYRAIREDSWTPRTTLCAQRRPIEPPDWAAGGVLHLLTHLLCKDPAKRFGITDVKASAWLLEGVQRRAEWIAGTTPRIVVSAADEANAIQVPRFKWNFGASLGRRFGKLFRTARDPTNSDGTGAVRSEPTVRLRSSSRKVEKAKGKGKERVDGDGPGLTRKNTKEKRKQQKQKSRSVDALTTLNTGAPKPRRSETAPGPVPPLSPSTTGSMSATSDRLRTRGFLRWPARLTAGRHSTEALGSASMAGPLLNAEQRTRSVVTRGGGSMGIDGVKDGEGSGAVEMGMHMGMGLGGAFNLDGGEVMGEAAGMIAVPRAVISNAPTVEDEDGAEPAVAAEDADEYSESGCSYGSDARIRDQEDGEVGYDYNGKEDYNGGDHEDDGPRNNVYDSTSSGDEDDIPITFKSARSRVPIPVPVPPLNGHPDVASDVDDDGAPLAIRADLGL